MLPLQCGFFLFLADFWSDFGAFINNLRVWLGRPNKAVNLLNSIIEMLYDEIGNLICSFKRLPFFHFGQRKTKSGIYSLF